uniref:Uncharacterized protein n=1 Tax=Setaria viridis TaxID=4556 RepID=A0A4U6WAZ9_SETVI|nr:hypothetical protein SEVIR_1G150500v2 [Setaria viridis]
MAFKEWRQRSGDPATGGGEGPNPQATGILAGLRPLPARLPEEDGRRRVPSMVSSAAVAARRDDGVLSWHLCPLGEAADPAILLTAHERRTSRPCRWTRGAREWARLLPAPGGAARLIGGPTRSAAEPDTCVRGPVEPDPLCPESGEARGSGEAELGLQGVGGARPQGTGLGEAERGSCLPCWADGRLYRPRRAWAFMTVVSMGFERSLVFPPNSSPLSLWWSGDAPPEAAVAVRGGSLQLFRDGRCCLRSLAEGLIR